MKTFYILALAGSLLILPLTPRPAAAESFLFASPAYTLDDPSGLSVEQLRQNYIEVSVDIEAAKVFGVSAGLTAPDFKKLKELLRYRVQLLQEFDHRGMEVPRVEP